MDQHIAGFAGVADGDLVFCHSHGVAYQADMTRSIEYGRSYFEMYAGYRGQPIEARLNRARTALVDRYVGPACPVLDVGIGSGAFLCARPNTFGWDVNPVASEWLRSAGRYRDDFESFSAFTFWDVLEHVPRPSDYFSRMEGGSCVFISMPIYRDLSDVRSSKHYKPNEHFYYFTEAGLSAWMALHGFRLLDVNEAETEAGRESILSFAFALARP